MIEGTSNFFLVQLFSRPCPRLVRFFSLQFVFHYFLWRIKKERCLLHLQSLSAREDSNVECSANLWTKTGKITGDYQTWKKDNKLGPCISLLFFLESTFHQKNNFKGRRTKGKKVNQAWQQETQHALTVKCLALIYSKSFVKRVAE